MNIFSEGYTRKQLSTLNIPTYSKGTIDLIHKEISAGSSPPGYIDHRVFISKCLTIPVFYVDDQLWMSITPMEVASHWVPIQKAKGHVGVAGIGLGYYLLQIMKKPEVKKITAYEINPEVIRYFQQYKRRKGFNKIKFVEGSLYNNLADEPYDFFYNDIYPELGSQEAIRDMEKFICEHENLNYDNYHYWGLEFDIYESLASRSVTAMLRVADCPFLTKFFQDWASYNKKYTAMDEQYSPYTIPFNRWFSYKK